MNPIKFTASTSWATAMAGLDRLTRGEVYDAIFAYAETGDCPEMSPKAAVAFGFIRIDLDIEKKKSDRMQEQRIAAINKRWGKTETKPE